MDANRNQLTYAPFPQLLFMDCERNMSMSRLISFLRIVSEVKNILPIGRRSVVSTNRRTLIIISFLFMLSFFFWTRSDSDWHELEHSIHFNRLSVKWTLCTSKSPSACVWCSPQFAYIRYRACDTTRDVRAKYHLIQFNDPKLIVHKF